MDNSWDGEIGETDCFISWYCIPWFKYAELVFFGVVGLFMTSAVIWHYRTLADHLDDTSAKLGAGVNAGVKLRTEYLSKRTTSMTNSIGDAALNMAGVAESAAGEMLRFVPAWIELTSKGELTFKEEEGGKTVRTISVKSCTAGRPKNSRKGHQHALRLDVPALSGQEQGKFVFSMSNEDEFSDWLEWLEILGQGLDLPGKVATLGSMVRCQYAPPNAVRSVLGKGVDKSTGALVGTIGVGASAIAGVGNMTAKGVEKAAGGINKTVRGATAATTSIVVIAAHAPGMVVKKALPLSVREASIEMAASIGSAPMKASNMAGYKAHEFVTDLIETAASLPLGWRIVWGIGVVGIVILAFTVLVALPCALLPPLTLWTALIVKLVGHPEPETAADTVVHENPFIIEGEIEVRVAGDEETGDANNPPKKNLLIVQNPSYDEDLLDETFDQGSLE